MITEAALTHLSEDPKLKTVIATTTPKIATTEQPDVYLDLLRSINGQQLSVKAAATIHGRFLDLFDERHPAPEKVLAMDTDTLRSAGLSRQKLSYIQNVAAYFQEKKSQNWEALSDTEIIEELTQIKGVGKWTVEMILMFTLQRPDVFPVDDLGIQRSMTQLYEIEGKGRALRQKLTEIAEPWRPYRTVACRYLWRWKNDALEKKNT